MITDRRTTGQSMLFFNLIFFKLSLRVTYYLLYHDQYMISHNKPAPTKENIHPLTVYYNFSWCFTNANCPDTIEQLMQQLWYFFVSALIALMIRQNLQRRIVGSIWIVDLVPLSVTSKVSSYLLFFTHIWLQMHMATSCGYT